MSTGAPGSELVVLSTWNLRASQGVECGLGRGLCQPVEAGAI